MGWRGCGMPSVCVGGRGSDSFVLWVAPPPLAVRVTLDVPVTAVRLTVNVSVELPLPGAAIEVGLKTAVTPVGSPDAVSDRAELKPPLTAVEIVVVPELPCVTDRLAGDAVTVKLGAAAGLIVRATVVV